MGKLGVFRAGGYKQSPERHQARYAGSAHSLIRHPGHHPTLAGISQSWPGESTYGRELLVEEITIGQPIGAAVAGTVERGDDRSDGRAGKRETCCPVRTALDAHRTLMKRTNRR